MRYTLASLKITRSQPLMISSQLNSAQQEAVRYIDGPLLVIAGAGSGKTKVITEKIKYLIENCRLAPHTIFGITFTNKAALEMKSRLAKMLGKNLASQIPISTFHTLGLNILRKHPEKLGLRPNFTLFDDQDSLGILRSLTDSNASLDKLDKSEAEKIAQAISRLKSGLITPELALKNAQQNSKQDPRALITARLYDRYQRQLHAFNAVDFDDLIFMPVQLFKQYPEIKQLWQRQVNYLLVDEYQDTNDSQYQLVYLLTSERQALTAVGDDDQSIYAWRGAKPENIHQLKTDYPKLNIILLEQNYRSTAPILNAANILIGNNSHLIQKKLFSQHPHGDPIKIIHCPNENIEAERIISEIIAHQFKYKTPYSHYAILYRSNHQAAIFEKELQTHRLPYKISGGVSIFSRAEIKDLLAFARLIANPSDDTAFLRVINTPKREIGPTTLEKLGLYAKERGLPFIYAIRELGLREILPLKTIEKLEQFSNFIFRYHQKINTEKLETIGALLEQLLEDIDYHSHLETLTQDEDLIKKRYANCLQVIGFIQSMAQSSTASSNTFTELLNRLMLNQSDQESESEDKNNHQIALSTLHASKGLEFPYVFLTGLEEGILPHQNSIDTGSIEEERRLAYVGITRARSTLVITLAQTRQKLRETLKTTPSRFLAELPQQELLIEGKAPENPSQQQALNQSKLSELRSFFKSK